MDSSEIRWDSDWRVPIDQAALRVSETGPSLAGSPDVVIMALADENEALRALVLSLRADVRQYRTMVSILLTAVGDLGKRLDDARAPDR